LLLLAALLMLLVVDPVLHPVLLPLLLRMLLLVRGWEAAPVLQGCAYGCQPAPEGLPRHLQELGESALGWCHRAGDPGS
jgi:hypothetical protein